MGLMPWGYVTTMWPTGRIYIIFVVNVTQTNFRIGFLYLTNSSNEAFLLRLYDYSTNNIQLWTFQGIQHIYNRTVSVTSVSLPELQIPAEAKVTNGLSALGPQLMLGSTQGEWVNGTTPLYIYPLYNQYFSGPNDYNELWSLLTDNNGTYYFAILYMQNSDHDHVIIEHKLRLNDYTSISGTTVDAKWTMGDFDDKVTVRTAIPNLVVNVDGFPFQANQLGILSVYVPSGYVTIEVPQEISEADNAKLTFSQWNEFGNQNPLKVLMNSSLDITAKFNQVFYVSVDSIYGSPQGSNWYPQGANATVSVTTPVNLGNGTRRIFMQWEGDSNSPSPQVSLTVDSAKQLIAAWKTQYQLTLNAPGLPTNATANILVGGRTVSLAGSKPVDEWINAGQQLTITVQNQHFQASSGNYSFAELLANNQTFGGVVIMTQPITVSLMYSTTPNSAPAPRLENSPNGYGTQNTANRGIAPILSYGLLGANNKPLLRPMISFAASLANIGYLLAAFLLPGGPPVAGYVLGSLFIGLIYVLPVSALVVLVATARTKRQPRLRTLAPLAVIWMAALALILLSTSVAGLQGLAASLQVLLMITTMVLFPLVIAFRMAKLVA